MNEKKDKVYVILQIIKIVITAIMGYLGGAGVSSCTHALIS